MNEQPQKNFSLTARAKSVTHAWRGVVLFLKTTHNAWLHIVILLLAIFLGFYFDITRVEWFMIIFAGGLVFVAEAFNTAIEIDMNLTSPDFHPHARDTKDVSAGAVLLSAITAFVVGVLVFGHYICALF